MSTSLEECERRDVKGLYRKARNGEIANFTGVSSPYEKPEYADVTVDTSQYSVDESVEMILKAMKPYLQSRRNER